MITFFAAIFICNENGLNWFIYSNILKHYPLLGIKLICWSRHSNVRKSFNISSAWWMATSSYCNNEQCKSEIQFLTVEHASVHNKQTNDIIHVVTKMLCLCIPLLYHHIHTIKAQHYTIFKTVIIFQSFIKQHTKILSSIQHEGRYNKKLNWKA